MDQQELQNRFVYHPPMTPEKVTLHESARAVMGKVAEWMNTSLPDSREKALVITHLEEALMWANAAIARNV